MVVSYNEIVAVRFSESLWIRVKRGKGIQIWAVEDSERGLELFTCATDAMKYYSSRLNGLERSIDSLYRATVETVALNKRIVSSIIDKNLDD